MSCARLANELYSSPFHSNIRKWKIHKYQEKALCPSCCLIFTKQSGFRSSAPALNESPNLCRSMRGLFKQNNTGSIWSCQEYTRFCWALGCVCTCLCVLSVWARVTFSCVMLIFCPVKGALSYQKPIRWLVVEAGYITCGWLSPLPLSGQTIDRAHVCLSQHWGREIVGGRRAGDGEKEGQTRLAESQLFHYLLATHTQVSTHTLL